MNVLSFALGLDPSNLEQGADRGARALKRLGAEADGVAVSHEKVHASLHLAAEALGDQFGEIGGLAHFLMDPYLLAAAGVVVAFHLLTEQAEKTHDRLKELFADSKISVDLFARSIVEGMRQAADVNEDFHRSLDHSADSFDSMADAMEHNIRAGDEYLSGMRDQISAQEDLQKSQIEGSRLAGNLTDPQALAATHAIEAQSRSAREKADEDAVRNRMSEMHTREIAAGVLLPSDTDKAVDAENKTTPTRQALAHLEGEMSIEEEKAKHALDRASDLKATLTQIKAGGPKGWAAAAAAGFPSPSELTDATDQYNKSTGQLENDRAHKAALEAQLKTQEAIAEAARKKAAMDKAALDTLGLQRAHEADILKIKQDNFAKTEATRQSLAKQQEMNALMTGVNWTQMFQATSMEKLGFHFAGNHAPTLLADHQRATAQNTGVMVGLLRELVENMHHLTNGN